jgi:cupin 2 domain-containing protein
MSSSIFALPFPLPQEEIFESFVETPLLRVERILSTGQTTPPGQWYDQERWEWVILLQGEAEIGYEDGRRIRLKPGDYLSIPPHQKHRVEFTSDAPPCIWLAIHYLDSSQSRVKIDS